MTDTEVGVFVDDGYDSQNNDDDDFGPPEEMSSKAPLEEVPSKESLEEVSSKSPCSEQPPPKKKRKQPAAPQGNYGRYYGYRTEDPRLDYIPQDRVAGKKCLDIGCNSGLFTLKIERRFRPQSILGVDVDPSLVKAANKYLEGCTDWQTFNAVAFRTEDFAAPTLAAPEVFERRGKFDVIFCLSVTKWVQLTAGDEGLMRLFRRVHEMLCDGGMFVLEPQPWKSYRKYAKLSAEHKANFKKIKVRPADFKDVLLRDVGFGRMDVLHEPGAKPANGFDRPVYAFFK